MPWLTLPRPEFAVVRKRVGIPASYQGLRTRVGWRVPTSSPGSASADGEDRLGGGDLELPEDVGELGTYGRGLNDGPALAGVADALEPRGGAGEPAPGQPGRDLGRALDHQRQHAQPHVR